MLSASLIDKILKPLIQVVAKMLETTYGVTHSYGVAIALVTLLMMLVLLPLTLKSTKSMLEMQKVAPLIKQIQQDYKNDIQGRNEATMALYKEHKINPAGGCLPILLQTPFFMTMWRVLFGLTNRCSPEGFTAGTCDGAQTGQFVPKYLNHGSEMYTSLKGQTRMGSIGLDLSQKAFDVIRDNVVRGLPYLAMVIVVGLLSYYQQRQITARQTGQASNPQQQMIMNLMPLFFGFISLTFASGLIIYFLVQNVFRIIQNIYITRKFYAASDAPIEVSGTVTKPTPTGTSTQSSKPTPAKNNAPKPLASAAPERKEPSNKPKAKPTPSVRPTPPVRNAGGPPRAARPTPKKK